MIRPDYPGGSIVNLMSTVRAALGGCPSPYPPLRGLEPAALGPGSLVLLVVDGLGYRHLLKARAGEALRRHLQGSMTSVFPSTTASAVTAFLSGVAPQQHGLTGWHTYFRELGTIVTVLPFRPRYGGPSLESAGITPAALLAPSPLFDALPLPCYAVSPARIVDSEFNSAYCGRARRVGYADLDGMFRAVADILKGDGERKYVYAYFPDIDGLAHDHGVASREVEARLAELDAAFARFLEAIRGSGSTVVVTADHGLIDTDPERLVDLGRHPRLARTLRLPLCGERRVAYCYLQPDKTRQFEDYVRTELAEFATLANSRELVERGWFGLGTPNPHLAERVGDYVLLMRGNHAVKDWVPGERHHLQVGMHGGTSEDEMFVPLIVARA